MTLRKTTSPSVSAQAPVVEQEGPRFGLRKTVLPKTEAPPKAEGTTPSMATLKKTTPVVPAPAPVVEQEAPKFGLRKTVLPKTDAVSGTSTPKTEGFTPSLVTLKKTTPASVPASTPVVEQEAPKFGLKKAAPPKADPASDSAGKTFTLSELQKFPPGVDKQRMELWLNSDEMVSVLGATLEEFSSWPPWKKERAKKKVGLW